MNTEDRDDIFSKSELADLVDSAAAKSMRRIMLASTVALGSAEVICISEAIRHGGEGNYGAMLTFAVLAGPILQMGINCAAKTYMLYRQPVEEMKTDTLEIAVSNPITDYLED